MQAADGKIVYLLPSTMMNTPPGAVSLPSQPKTQQYLSSTMPLQTPVIKVLPSEPPASLSNVDDSSPSEDPQPLSLTVNHPSIIEQSYALSRRVSSQDTLELPMLKTTTCPSNLSNKEQQKLREVEVLEAKLSTYQNVVEKYEKLAEEATTAAIDERRTQLRKLVEQLQKREQNAKAKLANAINVMEENQVIEDPIPVASASQGNNAQDHRIGGIRATKSAGNSCVTYYNNNYKIITNNSTYV